MGPEDRGASRSCRTVGTRGQGNDNLTMAGATATAARVVSSRRRSVQSQANNSVSGAADQARGQTAMRRGSDDLTYG